MRLCSLLVASAALFLPAFAAKADPVTYTLTGAFSGSLGGVSFSDTQATFTFVGDTSNVYTYYGYYENQDGVSTVSIAGFQTATVTSTTFGVSADTGYYGGPGFSDTTSGFAFGLINPLDPAVQNYELTAPFSADGYFSQGFLAGSYTTTTTLGDLIIDDGDDSAPTETFTATLTTAATPEPSSLLLLGTGALGVFGFMRRRFA